MISLLLLSGAASALDYGGASGLALDRQMLDARAVASSDDRRHPVDADSDPAGGLVLARDCCLNLALDSEPPEKSWGAGEGTEIHASFSLSPQYVSENRGSRYYVAPPTVDTPSGSLRNELELRIRHGGFNAQGILRQTLAEGSHPDYDGVVNQFYYDGQISPELGWTIGKKVMTWGVGFGFKPLDVIQREDRRAVNPLPLVGIPLLALESYTASAAWSVLLTRPGENRGETDGRDPGLAVRWYRLLDGDDLYALLRLSQRRKFEMGAGFAHVIGDQWSIHGAALYQRRAWQRHNRLLDTDATLATADPLLEQNTGGHAKLVAGAQWTGDAGFGVLLEAWYDGDAYRRRNWQALDALTARQRALLGLVPGSDIDGNVAWSSQAYQASNLLRENLLLRFSYDDRDGFKPYADLLLTPSDGGLVYTVGASWEGNRNRFALAWRQMGGRDDSAYARLPTQRIIWAEWHLALF